MPLWQLANNLQRLSLEHLPRDYYYEWVEGSEQSEQDEESLVAEQLPSNHPTSEEEAKKLYTASFLSAQSSLRSEAASCST